MSRESYQSPTTRHHGITLVTPAWREQQQQMVDELAAERAKGMGESVLIIPAAQHPLVDGVHPGTEFTRRLEAGLTQYANIIGSGGKAEFFVAGGRHHSVATKTAPAQTDKVALYDAAGLWLLNEGVPADNIHGKDWADRSGEMAYNGASELRIAYSGFFNNRRFESATYICSPGQQKRAKMYALANGFPVEIVVPDALENGQPGEQFHAGFSPQRIAVEGMAQTIDPHGDLLARMTANRIPIDGGGTGTLPEMLPDYAALAWYSSEAW
ncbi:MAG: hypothetical protein ABWX94_03480 [Candidatus Saccharimonadales bacterium]